MARDSELLGLVGRIYDAALDGAQWANLLRDAAEWVGCPSGVVGFHDFDGSEISFLESTGRDPSYWATYNAYYVHVSPYVGMMAAHGARSYATQDLISDKVLRATEYYTDWLRPQDIHYHAGAVVVRTPRSAALFEFQRGRRRGPFDARALANIAALAPHVRRSLLLARRLGTLQAGEKTLLEVLSGLDSGVILFDAAGRVFHMNATAAVWVRAGRLAVSARGVLSAAGEEGQRIPALIAACLRGEGGASLRLAGAGTLDDLAVTLMPVGAAAGEAHPGMSRVRAVLYLSRCASSPGLPALLRQFYGLTAAEARVAVALLEGEGAARTAQRLGVGRETVRTQTKAVFEKTGVRSQGQFIRLALTLPAAPTPPAR